MIPVPASQPNSTSDSRGHIHPLITQGGHRPMYENHRVMAPASRGATSSCPATARG